MRGCYRLIDQPAESAVTPANILAPHRAHTLHCMQRARAVLCLQDGTDIHRSEHSRCADRGLNDTTCNSKGMHGLHMHSTFVVYGEGLPLGVPLIQYEA